jgi:hypothetical protein
MGKKSRSGIRYEDPGSFSESLETLFWVKILKFFDANADPEQEFGNLFVRDGKIWIQDKHSGSATLDFVNHPEPQHTVYLHSYLRSLVN